MILVSFSSAEDALFNYVKKYDNFRSLGTKDPPFHFLGDTRYRGGGCYMPESVGGCTDRITQILENT